MDPALLLGQGEPAIVLGIIQTYNHLSPAGQASAYGNLSHIGEGAAEHQREMFTIGAIGALAGAALVFLARRKRGR